MAASSTHIDPEKLEPGNTKIRARGWCFTINNPDQGDPAHLSQYFERYEAIYVFQEEIGAEGTPHLQGFVQFKNQMQFSTLKMIMPRAHLEIARNWKKSKEYCSKIDTRNGLTHTNMEDIQINEVLVPNITLYE